MAEKHRTERLVGENDADYITCHSLRHAWEPTRCDREPQWGLMIAYRCTRCGTMRYDRVDRHGQRTSPPAYAWPDGYRDHEVHDANEWRMLLTGVVSSRGLLAVSEEDELRERRKSRRKAGGAA